MEAFPIQDLLKLEKDYAELKEDYASLEEIFNEALDEMNFNRYDEDRQLYESYLLKFNHIEYEMKDFKENLDKLKLGLAN